MESKSTPEHPDLDVRRWNRRRKLLTVGILLLLVFSIPCVFILLSGRGERATGPILGQVYRPVSPLVDVQRSEALARSGVGVKRLGMSFTSRGGFLGLGRTDYRGVMVRVTASEDPIEPEDLTYQLFDERGKVIGAGTLTLPATVDPGESVDGKVEVILREMDDPPAKLIIARRGE